MAEAVYLLCALTSLACAFLFLRSYGRSRLQLIFWTGLCFAGLALNNVLLFVDLVVFPVAPSLSVARNAVGLLAVALLLYGMISSEAA